MFKRVLILTLSVWLTACSSSGQFSVPGLMNDDVDIDFKNLYLRGVFNWWEATPAFQFSESSDGWYVDVELIADGQPYDFRLSDASWTPQQTCGAKYPGQSVSVSSTVFLVCNPGQQNVQFTPSTTGVYRFTVSPASGNEVALQISRQR
ncbi:hypothetical protein [Alteromonas sp. CYL-A6]|uniref:hypothetical protein n=1 Tax=Alteromonas nitratireducens TaxID=3390813 RepID=UPI0034AAF538